MQININKLLIIILLAPLLSVSVHANEESQICYFSSYQFNRFLYRILDSKIKMHGLSCDESEPSGIYDTEISIPIVGEYENRGFSVHAYYSYPDEQVSGVIFIQDRKTHNVPNHVRPRMYFYDIQGKHRCRGRYETKIAENPKQQTLIWYFDGSVDQSECKRLGEIQKIKNKPLSSI